MSSVLTEATSRATFGKVNVDSMIKYWYHFAIMFEALFILTTIDTGTRIARFLLQETLGKLNKKFDRMDWLPGAIFCTAAVTAGWGGLIWTGSIETIWPMFGIANQLLAVLALCVVTSVLVNTGRAKYAFVTILPMLFVIATTMTAANSMITGRFYDLLKQGLETDNLRMTIQGGLNIGVTVFLLLCVIVILASAVARWFFALSGNGPSAPARGKPKNTADVE
jgi:carbon starvation protein